jgi:hypothetical protein
MHALDFNKPHRVIIDQTQKTWYVQNGYVYDVHGNVLGKAEDLKAFAPRWYYVCNANCDLLYTFTKREDLEKHIFEKHRDMCIQMIPKPEGLTEGYFQPTEKAIEKAAKELAAQVVVEDKPFVASDATMEVPHKKLGRPSKADRKLATI